MKVKTYPDAILRQKCEEVKEGEFGEHDFLIEEMSETITYFDALGLAAPQVGQSVRIIGINPRHYREDEKGKKRKEPIPPKFMINPKIVDSSSTWIGKEACLSFPGVLVDIKRNASITVEYFDADGKAYSEDLFGEEAVIVQHEIDHLDGITLINKASQVYRGQIMRKLKVARRRMKKYAKANERLEKIGAKLKMIDEKAPIPAEAPASI